MHIESFVFGAICAGVTLLANLSLERRIKRIVAQMLRDAHDLEILRVDDPNVPNSAEGN